MIELTEAQYVMVKNYNDLLETMEQGFEYTIESFENMERTQGDQILADVFTAFSQINETNEAMLDIFTEEKDVSTKIDNFKGVIAEIAKLEEVFDDQAARQTIILNHIFPAFQAWKMAIQKALKTYIQQ